MRNSIGMNSISKKINAKSKRISSYDKTGGNSDYLVFKPNEKKEIAKIDGAGCIKHIWITLAQVKTKEKYHCLPRTIVLRMYWDKENTPSVEVPIGDFFGMGHGKTKNFSCAVLDMSPEDGKAWNCFFPMPFSSGARFEIENQSKNHVKFYFYIDYHELDEIANDELRFHAQWRREFPADGINEDDVSNEFFQFGGKNIDGKRNYVIMEAKGQGHYVGCNYNIHNLRFTHESNWYGEGDDMIFIDGEKWPPTLHGTGTEDYFNVSWCPQQEFIAPYHGIILGGGPNWSGKSTLYRYHIEDPIIFNESIKVTIEHGHNNHRNDDISTTAYWYQSEPHMTFPKLLICEKRLPLDDILPFDAINMKRIFNR